MRRAATGTILFLLVLALCGLVYEQIGERLDRSRFPQRGKSVIAGTLSFNLNCTGQGSPAVILEAGLGGTILDWIHVQPEVERFTRVCSYDRAGYGWSDPGPSPRTSAQSARELHALLEAAGEKPPFILVGHSLGGYIVRVFAGLYESSVAGMVLVEASHGDEDRRTLALLPPEVAARERQASQPRDWDAATAPLLRALGVQRLRAVLGQHGNPRITLQLREELYYVEHRPNYQATIEAENAAEAESWQQVLESGDLGRKPLIVLTAGKPYGPDPLLTPEQMQKQSRLWIEELQREFVRLSTQGRQIVVPESGHNMPFEGPEAITGAIRDIFEALQR